MFDSAIVTGRGLSTDEPDWAPLERFLPLALCGGFMWMYAARLEDGRQVQAYKHSESRRYLVLDGDADAYEYLGRSRYRRMRHSDALEQVFASWWLLTQATEGDREALREAFDAAWRRGNGDVGAGAHIAPSSPACGFRWLP